MVSVAAGAERQLLAAAEVAAEVAAERAEARGTDETSTLASEKDALREQAELLQGQLDRIRKRLNDLEGQGQTE